MKLPLTVTRLAPRTLVGVLSAGLIVLLAAAWSGLLRDPVNDYRALLAQRGASSLDVERERERLRAGQSVERAREAVARLEKELYGSGPQVPTSQMASHVIARLDALAERFRVSLDSVKPGAHTDLLGFTEVPFDVQVHGDYVQLIAWLEAVEAALQPMVLKRFHLQPAPAGDDNLHMELRVVSYRAPQV